MLATGARVLWRVPLEAWDRFPRCAQGICRGPKARLVSSRIRGGLRRCRTPAVTVSLCFHVGVRAAADAFAMDILLDDSVALPVNLPVY